MQSCTEATRQGKESHLALWLAMMAANELPRDFEIPGFEPDTQNPRPSESIQRLPEWRALLQRVKRAKRKGKLLYIDVSDEKLDEAAWMAYSTRFALLKIVRAQPGDVIPIGWLALCPDRLRIESGGTIRVLRDGVYEDLISSLNGRNKETISQCPVCRRLFLRTHSDQAVCSPGCRARKFLIKHPDKRLDLDAKRARRECRHDVEKRRKKLEENGQPKGSPDPHKRSPRTPIPH